MPSWQSGSPLLLAPENTHRLNIYMEILLTQSNNVYVITSMIYV
jgi:hypothetical protein